jgi:septum formation protein
MLVLASASPRRRELLALAGFSFEVRPAEIDESVAPGEEPVGYVTRLAREKAQAVLAALGADNAGVVVLGADTTVIVDGAILGKPVDVEDAKRMLRLLAGRMHRVATGVAVVTARSVEATAEMTTVEFLPMSEEEIAGYVATGEPMDKAGAYGIQGRAARWIPRVEGCYYNVMGLPVARVARMLAAAGAR